jgi:mono/diheme cytochrome c family protein
MAATLAFVLLFASAGLGTLLVAMRSGAGPKRLPGRSGRRAAVIGLPLLIVVLAVGVPVAVLARDGHHHSGVGPGGLALTTSAATHVNQVHGREVFALHCSTCHTLHAANAVGKVGPNLDLLVGGLQEPVSGKNSKTSYVAGAIQSGFAGQGQMPAQLVVGREAQDVASFVATVAGH